MAVYTKSYLFHTYGLQEVLNPREEADEDPFLRSIAMWMLKDYQGSLDTMLGSKFSSRVFNFYVFLRTHPLLVRQNKAKGTLALSIQERNLYYQTAHEHYAAGCPILAIHVLTQLPKIVHTHAKPASLVGSPVKDANILSKNVKIIESGVFGHDDHDSWDKTGASVVDHAPIQKSNALFSYSSEMCQICFGCIINILFDLGESALDFNWSDPASTLVSKLPEEDELKLDWDADAPDDEEEEEEKEIESKGKLKPQKSISGKAFTTEESFLAEEVEEEEESLNNPHTMISTELKLASCLKLMCEELANMVGQIEGTELRLHLYAWLEKQVPTLKELCRYKSDDDDLTQEEWTIRERLVW